MKNTIKFVAVCVAAPVVALGVAAPTAWAETGTGPCTSNCSVGGSPGNGLPPGNGAIHTIHHLSGIHSIDNGGEAIENMIGREAVLDHRHPPPATHIP
jgi:hypothetical protein